MSDPFNAFRSLLGIGVQSESATYDRVRAVRTRLTRRGHGRGSGHLYLPSVIRLRHLLLVRRVDAKTKALMHGHSLPRREGRSSFFVLAFEDAIGGREAYKHSTVMDSHLSIVPSDVDTIGVARLSDGPKHAERHRFGVVVNHLHALTYRERSHCTRDASATIHTLSTRRARRSNASPLRVSSLVSEELVSAFF